MISNVYFLKEDNTNSKMNIPAEVEKGKNLKDKIQY